MTDYKAAKEAFVADNEGASISSINAVSLVAWSSYALYATSARRLRHTFLTDYLTSVLPMLLAVTTSSSHPLLLNGILALLAVLFHYVRFTPSHSHAPLSDGVYYDPRRSTSSSPSRKPAGRWLDESDSDEEPSVPATATSKTFVTPIKLPSQAIASATAHSLSPSPSPLTPSDDPFGPGGSRLNKRRLSPLPSPEPHTVDILPTPDFPPDFPDSSPADYPTRTRGRVAGSHRAGAGGGEGEGEKRKLPFLSVYRAHMMVMTVHCILAVDFPVFPRWQGKCEDFGTSLMDVGVGSFVFSLGLVSTNSLVKSAAAQTSLLQAVFKAMSTSAAILLLGVVRVLMVKGSDYPEHVTEYGVHWNFFFTLGLLPVFGVLLQPLRRWIRWSTLGLLLSIAQQTTLHLGGQSWILSPARTGLIGMNKEGLTSLPGYIAIYLIGLATGEHVQRLAAPPPKRPASVSETTEEYVREHYAKRRTELALELFGYAVAWWSALGGMRYLGMDASRRMANLPYVLWIAAYNALFLFGYLVLEILLPSSNSTSTSSTHVGIGVPTVPPLLEAINKNGLAVFLVANLLTGLVNVSMETMYASTVAGMCVLVLYSLGVCAVAWGLRGVRLKI